MKRVPIVVLLVLLTACGTTVSVNQAPPKKTITVTLHAGEQLDIGNHKFSVQEIRTAVSFTIDGESVVVESGKSAVVGGNVVTVQMTRDSVGPVAQIQLTER